MQSITLLVPAHNEEEVIEDSVLGMKQYLDNLESISSYEIIICINNYTDRTEEISMKLSNKYNSITYFAIQEEGAGISLREGIRRASKDVIVWLPADGELMNGFIGESIKALEDCDVVSGSRYLVKNKVRSSSYTRRFLSISFSYMTRIMFGSGITEFGTVKSFKREWAQSINHKCHCDDFSFMIEILYHALRDGLQIKEIPVYMKIRRSSDKSKVRIFSSIFSLGFTTLKYGVLWRMRRFT